MKRVRWIAAAMVFCFLCTATVSVASSRSWWWDGDKYKFRSKSMKSGKSGKSGRRHKVSRGGAVGHVLTLHRHRLDDLVSGDGAAIAMAHVRGEPGTPTVTRFMTNIPGEPPVTVRRDPLWLGSYIVDFGAPVEGRYYNAVPGNGVFGVPLVAGFCDVTPRVGHPNSLYIRAFDAAGSPMDTNFYVEIW